MTKNSTANTYQSTMIRDLFKKTIIPKYNNHHFKNREKNQKLLLKIKKIHLQI